MSSEDFNRRMDFIVEQQAQQAQFAANFQKADERVARLEEL